MGELVKNDAAEDAAIGWTGPRCHCLDRKAGIGWNSLHPGSVLAVPLRISRVLVCAALVGVFALSLPGAAWGATASEILNARPLVPKDKGLFSPDVYPNTRPAKPAPGREPSARRVGVMLTAYLKDEFPGDKAKQRQARAVYTSRAAKQKIPSPSLRAAFAGLKGTFAEPAIAFFFNAKTRKGNPVIVEVRYGGTPSIAFVSPAGTSDDEQRRIIFLRSLQAENPFLWTPVWVHELLHHDSSPNGLFEEAAATSIEGLFRLRQRARHPGLAATGTELGRRLNDSTLARLNSGRGSRLGLFRSNENRQLFPGSSSVAHASWWQWEQQANHAGVPLRSSPGSALFGRLLRNLRPRGAPRCSTSTFNMALLNCIDKQGNGGLSERELVAAAKALKLRLPR